jgi:hypothetical protein
MKRFVLFVLVAGLVLAVGSAWALTLQPSVSNTQSWNGGTPGSPTNVGDANEDGKPYWDGDSDDYGLPGNIGNFLAKTGAFWDYSLSPGFAYPYIAGPDLSNGYMPGDVYFTSTNANWAAIRIEVAGLADYNYFGIYQQGSLPSDLNDLLNASSAQHVLLFKGSDHAGKTKTFTPPWSNFGWYLATEDKANPGTIKWAWFSERSQNKKKVGSSFVSFDTDLQHFAFFEVVPNQSYYIGVEDTPSDSADRDFNDIVVFASVVPDASTWMLFLSGVPALALLRRKRA